MRRSVCLATFLVAAVVPATVAGPSWAASEPRPAKVAEPAQRDPGQREPAQPEPAQPESVPGELLVRFADTAPVEPRAGTDRMQALERVGGRAAQSLHGAVPGLQRVVLEPDVAVEDAMAELEARDDVLYAEPNYVVRAAATPNDSRFRELWGLHNTGQKVNGATGSTDADIDAPEAWDVTTGSPNVTVAVLDTGIAYDHPDLAPNMWVNTDEIAGNGVDDDRNGFVDDRSGWDFVAGDKDATDEQGHGTHVAGTIGARGNNDTAGAGTTDMVGVAWNVRLMPVRVLDHHGNGTYAQLVDGISYAQRNGAHVGNLSLSGWDYSQALRDAMAATSSVTWVVAAGNDTGKDIDDYWPIFPCGFDLPNIVCVAATDSRDRLAGFSNFGPTSVDVAAPGVSTLSTSAYSRVFLDNFETSTGRWVTGGTPNTWARTTSVPLGAQGTWLTDSPNGNYPDNSNNWARTTAVDLRGKRSCAVKFYALVDTESWYDFYYVEAAKSPNGPWTQLGDRRSGFLEGVFDERLPASFDGTSAAYVRIRLNPDDQYNYDGMYVDDFAIECIGTYSAGNFQYLSGTSMATPHVSGVAALIKARNPSFTTAQLRTKLLASVDTKPSLTGKVATGGRINANKAVR